MKKSLITLITLLIAGAVFATTYTGTGTKAPPANIFVNLNQTDPAAIASDELRPPLLQNEMKAITQADMKKDVNYTERDATYFPWEAMNTQGTTGWSESEGKYDVGNGTISAGQTTNNYFKFKEANYASKKIIFGGRYEDKGMVASAKRMSGAMSNQRYNRMC